MLNRPFILLAFLFLTGIIVISYKIWFGLLVIFLAFLIVHIKFAQSRFLISLYVVFLVSFILFQSTNWLIGQYDISDEWRILLNRSSLFIIVAGLYLTHFFHKKTISFYHHKPQWNNHIKLPFHSISIFSFWIIGLIVNIAVFTPFVLQQDKSMLQSIFLFSLLFSTINAFFEEVIWRGVLFSSLQKTVSVTYATIVTSIGFGLLHLAIGIPLLISLLFSFAGVIYVIIVLKTNSIYPAILLHFVINVGMVLSGWIL